MSQAKVRRGQCPCQSLFLSLLILLLIFLLLPAGLAGLFDDTPHGYKLQRFETYDLEEGFNLRGTHRVPGLPAPRTPFKSQAEKEREAALAAKAAAKAAAKEARKRKKREAAVEVDPKTIERFRRAAMNKMLKDLRKLSWPDYKLNKTGNPFRDVRSACLFVPVFVVPSLLFCTLSPCHASVILSSCHSTWVTLSLPLSPSLPLSLPLPLSLSLPLCALHVVTSPVPCPLQFAAPHACHAKTPAVIL